MRVALVIEHFAPKGGVENVAWSVAHGLARAGDEVRVIARRAEPSAAVELTRVSVPAAWQPLRVLAFSRAADRARRGARHDVVHSFSRTLHQDVYRAGGGSHADYLERAYGRLGRRLRRLSPRHATLLGIERRVFADPRQIVQCNSAMVEREIRARYGVAPERLVVLPNGVDLERFHPERHASAGKALRLALGAKERAVWLFAGSGFHRKGLDTALRALARSPADAELWVAGADAPAPWRRLAGSLGVAERVRFLGPRADLEVVYAAADALLLPTRYDAFANVCLEAAASGRPVVTSGANGAAERLGEAGLVVADPEDVAGFAHALAELADPALRRRRGEAARRVAEGLGWDRHVQALRDLYRRVHPS
jgi:UDP-glucose:(heptosyl)LPS alpha-1,3-glucosyltransferase